MTQSEALQIESHEGIDPERAAELLLTEAAYLKLEAVWSLAMAGTPAELPSAVCRDLSPFGR